MRFRRSAKPGGVGEQKIEAPNPAEMEWVVGNVLLARALVAAYTGAPEETAPLDPQTLDDVFSRWHEDWHAAPPDQREDPNPYINAFGMAFGQQFVDGLGFRWAVVTDDHGTEIAVHGDPNDFLVFPPNLVAKRFENGETGFLASLYEEIVQRVRELRT